MNFIDFDLDILEYILSFLSIKEYNILLLCSKELYHKLTADGVGVYLESKYFGLTKDSDVRIFRKHDAKHCRSEPCHKLHLQLFSGSRFIHEEWRLCGVLHRRNAPAITFGTSKTCVTYCYKFGLLHSYNDKPAVVHPGKYKAWYTNGMLSRVGGPAILREDGSEEWYCDGLLHRVDGPAIKDTRSGYRAWYIKGALHNSHGYAVMNPLHEFRAYYFEGKLHRDDAGPAVLRDCGCREWYNKGVFMGSDFCNIDCLF